MWQLGLIGAGLLLAFMSQRGPANLVSVTSQVDGREYQVQNLPDKEKAADLMAKIHTNLETLINHYKSDPATIADPRVKTMVERFNPNNMMENNIGEDSTSYSENKGEKIVVCLRDKTQGYPFVDMNTVTFVVLHEMAHLMTITIGHTPEFWANFRRILQDSIQCGIYQEVNYSKNPTPYCGMTITDSPL
jgi:hypothetical protein